MKQSPVSDTDIEKLSAVFITTFPSGKEDIRDYKNGYS